MFSIGELLYFVKMEFDSFELHKKSINMNTLNAANINVQGRRDGFFLFHSKINCHISIVQMKRNVYNSVNWYLVVFRRAVIL